MPSVVGVTFKPVTKVYYFDPDGLEDLQPGERVVVDTSRGRALGVVTFPVREVSGTEISGTLKPVVRRASAWDLVQQDQMEHREGEALALCRERASTQGLDMKVVRVEYSFDGSSLLVYFTSEQRVDFRNLVHDLAQALRTRVEMRQIGVRDEAKFLSGCGRCGRDLCCSCWLRDFTPVSIKMAKQQDLPLNPAEISGACGRLLCCLSYENEFYADSHRHLPRINSTVMTPEGPGKVRQIHVLRNSVTVLVQSAADTKMMIEVPIPETDFKDPVSAQGCPNCPATTSLLSSSEDDEEESMDAAEDAWAERTPAAPRVVDEGSDQPQAPAATSGEGSQGRRKSRARHRGR